MTLDRCSCDVCCHRFSFCLRFCEQNGRQRHREFETKAWRRYVSPSSPTSSETVYRRTVRLSKGHSKVSLHCLHSSPTPQLPLPLGTVPAGLLPLASGRLRHLQHATRPRRNAGELGTGCSSDRWLFLNDCV